MSDLLLDHAGLALVGLLGVGLGAVVLAAVAARRAHRRRAAAFSAFAAERGLRFADPDPRWATALGGPPFSLGSRPRARYVLQGTVAQREVVAFDFTYETTGRDAQGNATTDTHRCAVWALRMPCPLPAVQLSPENVLSRIGHRLGLADLELESEAFNRAYRVSTRDPGLATALLPPRSMEVLLDGEVLALRTEGSWLLSWTTGVHDLGRLDARWARLGRLLDLVPAFVWTDRGAAGFDRLLAERLSDGPDLPKDPA